MKSHELIRELLQHANAKHLAAEMGLSSSLIYKWAEPEEAGGSGAPNPLDRVEQLARLTDPAKVAQWVCARTGGIYVKSPKAGGLDTHSLAAATHEVVQEFGDMLSTVAKAAVDGNITAVEAREIRALWQRLQSETEGFVRCCEHGDFRPMLERRPPAGKNTRAPQG
jgi:hypothetical protein